MVIRRLPSDSELYHHGIKGQKWGVRRYQNYDGSLTSTGRRKYGVNEKKGNKNSTETLKEYYKHRDISTRAYGSAFGAAVGVGLTLPLAITMRNLLPSAISGAMAAITIAVGKYHDKKAKDVIKNMNAKQKKYYNDFVKLEDKYENDEMDYDTFIKERKDLLNESSK